MMLGLKIMPIMIKNLSKAKLEVNLPPDEENLWTWKLGTSLLKFLRNNQPSFKMKNNIANFAKDMIKNLLKRTTKICTTTMLALCSPSANNAIRALK